MINSYPAVSTSTTPYQLLVAQGLVPNVTNVNIYGSQSSVGSTFIPVWENAAAYVFPASAQQMRLYSSSASDTNVSVTIQGLDASYNQVTEVLVLTNGTTGVLTTNSFFRINNLSVTRTSSVNPVGILYLAKSDKTVTYGQINVGIGRSQATIYTVPAGYTFYLQRVQGYTTAGNTKTTYYRSYTLSPTGIASAVLVTPFITDYKVERIVARPYLEKTDILFQASSDATSFVCLQVEGYLIKN
jgi:hypothetical protein